VSIPTGEVESIEEEARRLRRRTEEYQREQQRGRRRLAAVPPPPTPAPAPTAAPTPDVLTRATIEPPAAPPPLLERQARAYTGQEQPETTLARSLALYRRVMPNVERMQAQAGQVRTALDVQNAQRKAVEAASMGGKGKMPGVPLAQLPRAPAEEAAVARGELGGTPTGPSIVKLGLSVVGTELLTTAVAALVLKFPTLAAFMGEGYLEQKGIIPGKPVTRVTELAAGSMSSNLQEWDVPKNVADFVAQSVVWMSVGKAPEAGMQRDLLAAFQGLSKEDVGKAIGALRKPVLEGERGALGREGALPHWGKLVQQFPETGQADAESLARTLQQRFPDRKFEAKFNPAKGDEGASWSVNDLTAGAKNVELAAAEVPALGREGAVPPVRPPVEPPPPTEGLPPAAPLDDSSRTLDYFLGAPKSEKAQRTLIRRYEGQVGEELAEADVAIGQLRAQANAAGLKFSNKPTQDVPAIMEVLDYPGSVDEAIAAVGLSDDEAALARGLRAALDKETALLKRDVPDFSFREFYYPHELVKAEKPRMPHEFRGTPVGAKPGFTRQRKLQGTLAEILEERPDLAIRSDDPIAVVARRLHQGALYRQQFVLINQMKRVGLAIRQSELPEGVSGWRTPKEVVAFNSRPISGKPGVYTEPWVVPRELAGAIEDNFGRSAFTSNIPLNALRQTVAGLRFVKTFGGLFQHFDYAIRTLGSATKYRDLRMVATIPKAFYRGFFPGAHAKWLEWEMTSSDVGAVARRALLSHGINTQAGLSFMGREYEAIAKEFFVYRTPLVGRALKAFGSGTYVNAHREYMLDIGERLIGYYQRAGMTLDEAAAKVALAMNERFSSLPAWQSVLRNPTTRDVMRTALFSMAEQESWVRMPLRQKAFLMSVLLDVIGLSNMINLMTTGKPLPLSAYVPFVRNPESPTGIDYNVRFLRPELPWRGPDGRKQYLDLLGQADTPMRMLLSPVMAAETRLGQVPSIAKQLIAGKSTFGEQPLDDWRDIGMFLAEQVSPIPAAGFWSEYQRIGLRGAVIQGMGLNVSAEKLRDLRNRTATEETGKPYDEFTRQEQKDWRNKHPEQFATSSELPEGTPIQQAVALTEERTERVRALGVQLENGEITGTQYAADHGDIVQEIATRRAEIPPQNFKPETDEEKALDIYYRKLDKARTDSPTKLLDSEDFDAAEQAVMEELGEKGLAALETAMAASGDRNEVVFYADRKIVNESGFRDIADLIWQEEAKKRGLSSATMTFHEVTDAVADSLLDQGIEPTATQINREMIDRGWKPVLDAIDKARIQSRINHPDIEARCLRWGINGMTTARSEESMNLFQQMTGRQIKPAATGLFKFRDGKVIENLGTWCENHEHEVCNLI